MAEALRAGNFKVVQPALGELAISDHRLHVTPPPDCSPYSAITITKH
jgi:hypothetical protein